jgi:hypothetical protein
VLEVFGVEHGGKRVDVALPPVDPRERDEEAGGDHRGREPEQCVAAAEKEVGAADEPDRRGQRDVAEPGGHEVVDGAVGDAQHQDGREKRRVLQGWVQEGAGGRRQQDEADEPAPDRSRRQPTGPRARRADGLAHPRHPATTHW